MQITDILNQTGGLQSIARELGISEAEAASGASALAPAILGGFQNQVQNQPGGEEGLGGLLGQLGGAGLMDNVVAPQPTDVTPGNQLLGQIFGSKETSRTVAQNAAAQTGLQPSVLKKMLPMLTMLLAGYMARQAGARAGGGAGAGAGMGGGLGSILGGILGGGGLGGILGGMGGAPGAGGTRGTGNPLNDILGMGRQ
ncbi:MAG TPA: DUF937 domain-containing protein [Gemmatimonadaceae bacterium]|nr:DUF937 domain-containing protein [Gemmatimonadaceae bacterium]